MAALFLALALSVCAGVPHVGAVSVETPPDSSDVAPVSPLADRVDVLYFHRTIRCETCIKFERYAHDALVAGYAADIARGRLTWSVLNFEEEENAEFVERYDVFESSLVVSSVRDSVEVEWEKLEAIWGLVSDRNAYTGYVSAKVDTAMREMTNGNVEQGEGSVPLHR